jgi:2-dehydro-3-deoxyphosphogluconate aldolase / (4S)-4-hydroxy-2-oxoglutarate aldolase
MAFMSDNVLDLIRENGVVLVIRSKTPDLIVDGAKAVMAGGIRCMEVTFTVANAPKVISAIRDSIKDVVLGAGTVTKPEQVDQAVNAGAAYIVSPGFDSKIIERCRKRGVASCPGVYTATEVMAAVNAGADVLKLFPAGSAGLDYFKALQGPFPNQRWLPTGGLGAKDLADWFKAGAMAVGAGGKLFPPELVEAKKWDELTTVAVDFMEAVKKARAK